jgi:chromosome partitioning protein
MDSKCILGKCLLFVKRGMGIYLLLWDEYCLIKASLCTYAFLSIDYQHSNHILCSRLRIRSKMEYKNMNIFCITNNKGGVAKTTSTVDLAYAIADKGFKVLVVDTDPQCNSTYSLLGSLDQSKTLFEVLIDGIPLEQTIVPTQHKNLFVAPCSINLSAADLMLASAHGRERKLEKAIRPIKDFYDFIIIDTPPHLGVLTINALIACTDVLIPFSLTTYSLIGVGILEKTMQELRDNLDVALPILGVFACLDDHTNINKNVLHAIKSMFKDKVFNTVIPRNIAIEEAHNQTTSLFKYQPKSKGAKAYEELANEILERVKLTYGK